MRTRTLKRALSTGVASTVIASGLVLGASPAPAAEPEPPVQTGPLEDLLGLVDLESLLLQGPQLLGTGEIGAPLQLLAPVFDTLPLGLLIQNDVTWLCDGEVIPGTAGLPTLVPTEAMAGCQIAAQTVSTLLGLVPLDVLSLVTNVIDIPLPPDTEPPDAEAPVATTPARISGTPEVGEVLRVSDPVWDRPVDSTTYAWQRDGAAIPGATGKSYTVVAADAGTSITATVTGVRGDQSTTSTSNALQVAVPESEQLVATVAPSITGGNRVGGILRIDPGTWLDGLVEPLFSYQWYNTDGPIPGADSRDYVPTPADAGRYLAATVEATLGGFQDGRAVTNIVKVQKLASKTRLKKLKGDKLRIRLAPAAVSPTGKVRLRDGRKTVRTIRFRAADNGRRIVRLPKLRRGVHRIKAVYGGNQALERSRSKVVRIRVR